MKTKKQEIPFPFCVFLNHNFFVFFVLKQAEMCHEDYVRVSFSKHPVVISKSQVRVHDM